MQVRTNRRKRRDQVWLLQRLIQQASIPPIRTCARCVEDLPLAEQRKARNEERKALGLPPIEDPPKQEAQRTGSRRGNTQALAVLSWALCMAPLINRRLAGEVRS